MTTDSAGRPGRPPGEEPPKPANEVTADLLASLPPNLVPVKSSCAPFHELIVEALERGRNAVSIYPQLVDGHGYARSYESVKRYVRGLKAAPAREAHPVIETAPGEEAQVDYGEGPMVRCPETGKYQRTRLFVMTLGFSRKSVRLLTWKSSSETWARLHETAYRRLGGVPRTTVLDNLREGVLKPDVYEPGVNPLYREVLAHYGSVALPCRVRHPDRKGKVESAIGHTQRTPLTGMRFETLAAAQAHLDAWETRWADTRIHGTTRRQVAAMFAEEKPHLLPLPAEPFRYYRFGERRVHLDGSRGSGRRLLHGAPGPHRPRHPRPVGRVARAPGGPTHGDPPARARAPSAGPLPRRRRGPSEEDSFDDAGAARARGAQASPSERSATRCTGVSPWWGCAEFSGCSASPGSTASQAWTTRAPRHWKSTCRRTALSATTWSAAALRLSV